MPSEYEHMVPVDGRPLPGMPHADSRAAFKVALSVCSRTGTRCFFNVISGKLLFCYGNEPFGGPLMVPYRTLEGTRHYGASACDGMVEYIRLGLLSRIEKDRIAAQNAKAEKDEAEKLGQKFRDDVRPDVLSYAAHLDQRRRGVQKLILAL
jgi:hypothetical protein